MTQYIIIGGIALVVLFVAVYIKMTIDEKKGANSEEKQKIQEIVKKGVLYRGLRHPGGTHARRRGPDGDNHHQLLVLCGCVQAGGPVSGAAVL